MQTFFGPHSYTECCTPTAGYTQRKRNGKLFGHFGLAIFFLAAGYISNKPCVHFVPLFNCMEWLTKMKTLFLNGTIATLYRTLYFLFDPSLSNSLSLSFCYPLPHLFSVSLSCQARGRGEKEKAEDSWPHIARRKRNIDYSEREREREREREKASKKSSPSKKCRSIETPGLTRARTHARTHARTQRQ